jgi:hypothetical protein
MEDRLSAELKRDLKKLDRRAKQIDRIEKKLGREAANIARERLMLQAIDCDNDRDLECDAAEF